MMTTTTRKRVGESKEINGVTHEAKIGSLVELDNGRTDRLYPGDDFCDSSFAGCDFRFPNPVREWHFDHAIACNVSVTGRTVQFRHGSETWVRAKIEFVGDGEPSEFIGGWLKVESDEARIDNYEHNCRFYGVDVSDRGDSHEQPQRKGEDESQ